MAEAMDHERPGRWQLRCHVCGRVMAACFHEFAQREGDWPHCCGKPMAVYFHGHPLTGPTTDDSPGEHPGA
jgi:hypothetical protein